MINKQILINKEVNVYDKDVSNSKVNLDAEIIHYNGWVEDALIDEDNNLWIEIQGYGWARADHCLDII